MQHKLGFSIDRRVAGFLPPVNLNYLYQWGVSSIVSLSLLWVVGCEVTVKTNPKNIRQSYFKDEYGICYTATSSPNCGLSYVISIATVPCEKVGL